jgi:uncharacterized protein
VNAWSLTKFRKSRALDVVHREIEQRKVRFALTGSSARKLKRGDANLLAGRAFVYNLFPMVAEELGESFDLGQALRWGTLPRIFALARDDEREAFLDAYVHTYFKEEVVAEQLVRKVEPFRNFLEVAAQANGSILNRSKIAEDVGVDDKTIKTYFDILQDTLLGFFLPAYHKSVRKQQISAPKFYLFDCGVKRALENLSGVPLGSASEFGRAFEHFVICEAVRLNSYFRRKYKFSYLATKGGLEIDLVVERPAHRTVLVEIKSSTEVFPRHLAHLEAVAAEHPEFEAYCLCRECSARKVGEIHILPWQEGLKQIGLAGSTAPFEP